MSISIESGIRKLDFKIEGSKKNLLHSSESLIKRTLRNLRSPPHQRPNWTTFSVHSTPPLTEISSIAISNRRPSSSNDKVNYYTTKDESKSDVCTNCYPYYSTSFYKKLNYWITTGRGREKSWIRSIHGNPPPTIAIPSSLLVNIDVGITIPEKSVEYSNQPGSPCCFVIDLSN